MKIKDGQKKYADIKYNNKIFICTQSFNGKDYSF